MNLNFLELIILQLILLLGSSFQMTAQSETSSDLCSHLDSFKNLNAQVDLSCKETYKQMIDDQKRFRKQLNSIFEREELKIIKKLKRRYNKKISKEYKNRIRNLKAFKQLDCSSKYYKLKARRTAQFEADRFQNFWLGSWWIQNLLLKEKAIENTALFFQEKYSIELKELSNSVFDNSRMYLNCCNKVQLEFTGNTFEEKNSLNRKMKNGKKWYPELNLERVVFLLCLE